jgi:hypothetical protein
MVLYVVMFKEPGGRWIVEDQMWEWWPFRYGRNWRRARLHAAALRNALPPGSRVRIVIILFPGGRGGKGCSRAHKCVGRGREGREGGMVLLVLAMGASDFHLGVSAQSVPINKFNKMLCASICVCDFARSRYGCC